MYGPRTEVSRRRPKTDAVVRVPHPTIVVGAVQSPHESITPDWFPESSVKLWFTVIFSKESPFVPIHTNRLGCVRSGWVTG